MHGGYPGIATGHVCLSVGNAVDTTHFFEQLGIRAIVEQEDFSVLEPRGGAHLVLCTWKEPEISVHFDIMVNDVDATYARLKGDGMEVTDISRGRIHDSFDVQTPGRRALTMTSSQAGDRVV